MTDSKPELEEYELEQLNQKLNLIADVIDDGTHPTVSITHFVPDERKAGGAIIETTDTIKRIDAVYRKVVLMSTTELAGINKTIDIDKILGIKGELVDYMDDVIE